MRIGTDLELQEQNLLTQFAKLETGFRNITGEINAEESYGQDPVG